MLLVKSWKKDLVDLHLQRQMERDEDTSNSSISSGSLSSTQPSDAEVSAPAGQSTLQETITSRLSVLNNLSEAPKDSNSHSASETSTYLARPNRMQSFVGTRSFVVDLFLHSGGPAFGDSAMVKKWTPDLLICKSISLCH